MANLLKGKDVANAINEKSISLLNNLKQKGIVPTLAIVRVGQNDADISYEKSATKKANEIGVNVEHITLDCNIDFDSFYSKLDELNNNDNIHGILLLRPLPNHLDNEKARNYINPLKDIDGCSDASFASIFTNKNVGFAPCTAQAVMEILDYYNIDVKSKNVIVIGRSLVVGKPVSMLLLNKNATVTIAHSNSLDLAELCKKQDIIVACCGQMESVNRNYVNDNQTIIDVGINFNQTKQKLCGDVLFEEVEPIVKNITPVPGGVGAVTSSILINHVIIAASK